MKPMGSIPAGFTADQNGELLIGGESCSALAAQAGDTPLFVYDFGRIRSRIAELRGAMPADLRLHFAMKANPLPELVALIAKLVDGLDVASAGEMAIAIESSEHVSFAGPGKRDRELAAAIEAGVTINLESEGEARRALEVAQESGIRPKLAVRVNPDFDLKGSGMRMGGGAKPFGVDAEKVPELVRMLLTEGADWRGFHIFAGSQALDSQAIADTQSLSVQLAGRLAADVGDCPPLVNLGGGFGIPYFPGEKPINLSLIGDKLADSLAGRDVSLAGSHFAIELGRYIVGESGVYLTRIVDRKQSHGETFLVTDGGLHHQLAASGNFGTVVRRNYPVAVATKFSSDSDETVTVVGCLCTPLDKLGDSIAVPHADVGDLIAIFMAGAYGASASPSRFLGHPEPSELVVNK